MPSLSAREKAIVLGGIMLGMFLASLNQTTVITAMPRIVASLGGMHLYSWVFSSYMLASTIAVPIFGKMSDLFGRRPLFVSGLALFTAASALNGAAQDMEQLVIFRGIQGLAAAAVMPLVMITIGDLFPPAQRGKFQGAIASIWAISSFIGPILGGFFVDNWSWRWVFFFNIPLGLVATVVAFFALKKLGKPSRKPSIDYGGMAALTGGVVALLLALLLAGNQHPWGSPSIISLFGLSAAMFALFPLVERRAEEPIIPLSLFRDSNFAISMGVGFLTGATMFGATMFVPLLLQAVLGTSATGSGLIMLPQTIGLVAGSTLGGFIIARLGYRAIAWVGSGLTVLGMYVLTLIGTQSSYETALLSMTILGFGLGATLPTFVLLVQNTVEHAHMGAATSSLQFFRQMGGTIGVTLLGALLSARLASELSSRLPSGTAQPLGAAPVGGSLDPQALLDPAAAATIPPELLEMVRAALSISLHDVFLLALVVTAFGFVLCLFLKEAPLGRDWQTPGPEKAAATSQPRPHLLMAAEATSDPPESRGLT